MSIRRSAIVGEARSWIGTPYRHQASLKRVGCDCLGLVRGVWRALYGDEAETLPAYSRDWAQSTGQETLLEAARRHLTEVAPASGAQPGDVLSRDVVLAPGRYRVFCSLPGHEELGMRTSLTVDA